MKISLSRFGGIGGVANTYKWENKYGFNRFGVIGSATNTYEQKKMI
jgi:hypothetical protein